MTAEIYLTAGLWIGLALLASLISIRIGVSVALLEIGMGIVETLSDSRSHAVLMRGHGVFTIGAQCPRGGEGCGAV